jgi:hypothetical protein
MLDKTFPSLRSPQKANVRPWWGLGYDRARRRPVACRSSDGSLHARQSAGLRSAAAGRPNACSSGTRRSWPLLEHAERLEARAAALRAQACQHLCT